MKKSYAVTAFCLLSLGGQGTRIKPDKQLPCILRNAVTPEKHQSETRPGGVALLDVDNDGRLDVYLVNGAEQPSLKKASPEFDDETQVFITANPGTEYQTIIQVLDAVRTTPQGESLFTDANFKVPR